MDKRRKLIRNITIDAMFLAIIIIMTMVPYMGFITIGPFSATLIHIIVFIGAYLGGWKKGLLYGFFFGAVSWFKALTAASGFDLFFVNPLISFLPRIIFGLITGLVFDLIKKTNNQRTRTLQTIVATVLLSIMHSVLTLTSLGLLEGVAVSGTMKDYWQLMGIVILTNGTAEAVVAGIAIIPIGKALEKKLSNNDI